MKLFVLIGELNSGLLEALTALTEYEVTCSEKTFNFLLNKYYSKKYLSLNFIEIDVDKDEVLKRIRPKEKKVKFEMV